MNTSEIKNERAYSLDALKMVAAVLVVFQHSVGTGNISAQLLAISRIAVPLFMMITGYLYIDVLDRKKADKQIQKFIMIALGMAGLYFLLDCALHFILKDIKEYLGLFLDFKNIRNFILFNDSIAADHAWYMWAMIYTLIIAKVFPIIYKNKLFRNVLIVVGLLCSLVFGKYALAVFGFEFLPTYTRNAWMVGIPYFLIGISLREHADFLKSRKKVLIISIVLMSIISCLIERELLVLCSVNATKDSYIFTTVLSIAVFILFLSNDRINTWSRTAYCGKKYSLILYIIHPLFVRIEKRVFPMNTIWQYCGFLVVLVCAFVTSILIIKGFDLLKQRDMNINKVKDGIKSGGSEDV